MDAQEQAKALILAARAAAASHAEAIRTAPELTRELVRREVRGYILAKFHLTEADCVTESFPELAAISLSKSMRLSPELVKEFDLAHSCDGVTSQTAKMVLLFLALQRDLGTALIYYLSTLVVFYIACGNIPLTLLGAGGGVGAAILGYRMFAHVKVRVAMWKNPWSDPTGGGYQIIQALLAISSGGLFGMGLGQGTPEKIPAYYNDFIFAVICEQFGQIFGILLLLLYVIILARAVTLVNRSRRSLTMLLGYGTVAMLGIQTFMITGGVIKLIPLTGVTMPFLSYGGSSMLSCMVMIGILHGISGKQQVETKESVPGKGGNNH